MAPKKYFDLYDQEKIEIPEIPIDYLETLPEPAAKSIRAKKDQLNLKKERAQERFLDPMSNTAVSKFGFREVLYVLPYRIPKLLKIMFHKTLLMAFASSLGSAEAQACHSYTDRTETYGSRRAPVAIA